MTVTGGSALSLITTPSGDTEGGQEETGKQEIANKGLQVEEVSHNQGKVEVSIVSADIRTTDHIHDVDGKF